MTLGSVVNVETTDPDGNATLTEYGPGTINRSDVDTVDQWSVLQAAAGPDAPIAPDTDAAIPKPSKRSRGRSTNDADTGAETEQE